MTSKTFITRIAVPLLLLAACSSETKPEQRVSVTAPLERVEATTVAATHAVPGAVRSATVSVLSARVVGNVTRVHVSVGDRVRAGQVLVDIDDRQARAQSESATSGRQQSSEAIAAASAAVDAARANATLASSTFARFAALRQRGSVSAQEFEDAQARNSAAQAELERAERTHAQLVARGGEVRAGVTQAATFLDDTRVRAPIDGVVTARFVDPGAQAAPGMPLLTVEDTRHFRVEATVSEDIVVRPGDPVTIETGQESLKARVTRVRPAVDAVSHAALVEIDLERPLRSGSYARVLFEKGQRRAITIPDTAIVRHGQLASVFVLGSDRVARMRLVILGSTTSPSGRSEVLSGLDAGETIVSVTSGVHDGATVRSNS